MVLIGTRPRIINKIILVRPFNSENAFTKMSVNKLSIKDCVYIAAVGLRERLYPTRDPFY